MKIVWSRSLGWNLDIRKMEYSIITDGCDCYPWHEVYAWWPVKTVSGKYVWRTKVFKRKVWVVWGQANFHMEPEVQYATAFDLLDEQYDKVLGR
jgi:hypothetical protein